MSRKASFLLIILCLVAALGGCAQNAKREDAGSDAAVAITHVRQLVAADNKTARTINVGGKGKTAVYAGIS